MPKQNAETMKTLNTQSASNGQMAKELELIPLDKTQLVTREDIENIVAKAEVEPQVDEPVLVEERDEFLSD